MDQPYSIWPLLIAGGAVMGFFIKPGLIGGAGVYLTLLAVCGLFVSGAFGGETTRWMFYLATMGIPVIFGMLWIGSLIGAALRRLVRKKKT